MSTGKVLLGVLAGIAAGATLGILFAPDKGSNTRRKITKKGEGYAEELKDKFNDLFTTLSEKYEEVKEETEELVGKTKAKFNDSKKEFESSNS